MTDAPRSNRPTLASVQQMPLTEVLALLAEHLALLQASVTVDGRYAAIISTPGPGGNALTVLDLTSPVWTPYPLVEQTDVIWSVIGRQGLARWRAHAGQAECLR